MRRQLWSVQFERRHPETSNVVVLTSRARSKRPVPAAYCVRGSLAFGQPDQPAQQHGQADYRFLLTGVAALLHSRGFLSDQWFGLVLFGRHEGSDEGESGDNGFRGDRDRCVARVWHLPVSTDQLSDVIV